MPDIVTVGDNIYWEDGDPALLESRIGAYYADWIYPYEGEHGSGRFVRDGKNHFWPAVGNHEYQTPIGATTYFDYFEVPGNERWYDIVLGPVHLFFLDTGFIAAPDYEGPQGVSPDGAQGIWLRAQLEASDAIFKVVVIHNAPYTSSFGGPKAFHTLPYRWPFKAWGADLVLAGHAHNYERHVGPDGLTYTVNGLGGSSRFNIINRPIKESVFHYDEDFGAQLIVATEEWLDVSFINVDGEFIDNFRILSGR